MYSMCMSVLDIRMWPRGDVFGLGLTDGVIGLLRRVEYDILAQDLIGLIECSYHQGIPCFLEAQREKTLGLSVLAWSNFMMGD
jgi:hypothetical protein